MQVCGYCQRPEQAPPRNGLYMVVVKPCVRGVSERLGIGIFDMGFRHYMVYTIFDTDANNSNHG
jgi:hypothetical protein